MEIAYLNVDLELQSKGSLKSILKAFGNEVIVLYQGKKQGQHFASLELVSMSKNVDWVVNKLCLLVERLSPQNRAIWNDCSSIVFDIGFESGLRPQGISWQLKSKTLRRVSSIGGSIVITIYAVSDEEEQ